MADEYQNIPNLIAAVIKQAVKDWQQGNNPPALREYFASEDFGEYLEFVGLDSRRIPAMITANQFDGNKLRAAYH